MITRFHKHTLPFLLMGMLGFIVSSCGGDGFVADLESNTANFVGWVVYGEGNDAKTGDPDPVEGATVTLTEYPTGTVTDTVGTDFDGYFILEAVKEGTYTISISLDGFEPIEGTFVASYEKDLNKGTYELDSNNGGPLVLFEPDMSVEVMPFKENNGSTYLKLAPNEEVFNGYEFVQAEYQLDQTGGPGDITMTYNYPSDWWSNITPGSTQSITADLTVNGVRLFKWDAVSLSQSLLRATSTDGMTWKIASADMTSYQKQYTGTCDDSPAGLLSCPRLSAGDTIQIWFSQTAITPIRGAFRSMGQTTNSANPAVNATVCNNSDNNTWTNCKFH